LGVQEFARGPKRRELPKGARAQARRGREASVNARRKLILIRRDDVEHLIMTALIETGIEGHKQLEQPVGDLIIANTDTRPATSGPEAGSNQGKPPIRTCHTAKFALDRDTRATVVSLVRGAELS
jgi:hypothetical protein